MQELHFALFIIICILSVQPMQYLLPLEKQIRNIQLLIWTSITMATVEALKHLIWP